MPIPVDCPCGARLGAPDHAAGKVIRCPKCQGEIRVPPDTTIPVLDLAQIDRPAPNQGRTPCPYCAEMILPQAKICPECQSPLGTGPEKRCIDCGSINSAMILNCRNCGSVLPVSGGPPAPIFRRPQTRAFSSGEDTLQPMDWILGILVPCVGLILGVIHLSSGRRGRGGKLIGLSIIMMILGASCHLATNPRGF